MKVAQKARRTSRSAAKQAGRVASKQPEDSPGRSTNEFGVPSFGEPLRQKARVKVTYAGKKMQRSLVKRRRSSSSLSSVSLESEPGNKRTEALWRPSPSPPPEPQATPVKPKNNRTARTVPRPSVPSSRYNAKTPPSSHQLTRSRSLSSLSSLSEATSDHPGWGIEDHKLVFVRVDNGGSISEDSSAMWWPAEVTELGDPMRVTLFGEYPGSSPKSPQRELVVQSSASVVLPFCSGPRQLRFNMRTYFSSPGITESITASPRKKQKTSRADLDTRWCDARNLMLKKYQDMNDGLPLTLSLHVRSDSPDVNEIPQQDSARQSSIALSSIYSSPEDNFWEPDESPYDIPGELVLAREKRTFTQYWPAKLMEYIPPKRRGEKALYQVLFYDGKVKKLPEDSDMFYNTSHPKFKSCMLGQDQNNYGLHVGEKDEDGDLYGPGMFPDGDLTVESLRSCSPVPQTPAPLAFASELSVEEQLKYVTPVLSAILTGQYEPARQKHVRFMKGGKQRNAVIAAAWKRGEITIGEKEELSTCIVHWMRRRQKRQDLGLSPVDPFVTIDPPDGSSGVQDEMEAIRAYNDDESDGSALTEMTGSDSAKTDTQRAPSSEIEAPPSSFVTIDDPEENVGIDVTVRQDGDDTTSSDRTNGDPGQAELKEDMVIDGDNTSAGVSHSSATNLSAETPLWHPTTMANNELGLPPLGTVATFAHLSDLDQFTYCTSVLLPEAILQILLWRNGERKDVKLLAPAEEARLHGIAERLASATYWVHDIVKLKHLAEGKLLPSASQSTDPVSTPGNSRLRPRRK